MHPNLDEIVARAVSHGMVVTAISNAYPITKGWIERMNDAGLSLLQVSVDNMEPNDVSQKSWSKIKKRLLLLKEHARFKLNVNAVLGSSPPEQTRHLIDEIRSLGFYMTVGLLHDQQGQIDPGLIGDILPEFYEEMRALCNKSSSISSAKAGNKRCCKEARLRGAAGRAGATSTSTSLAKWPIAASAGPNRTLPCSSTRAAISNASMTGPRAAKKAAPSRAFDAPRA